MLLVDGMNVIGSRPDGWWRDRPGAQRRLVEEIEAYCASSGEEVIVVFDGRPWEPEPGEAGPRVTFAARRGPNAADDEIVRVVADDPDPSRLTVVTSDAELARRVRKAGAQVLGAGSFRRRLDELAGS